MPSVCPACALRVPCRRAISVLPCRREHRNHKVGRSAPGLHPVCTRSAPGTTTTSFWHPVGHEVDANGALSGGTGPLWAPFGTKLCLPGDLSLRDGSAMGLQQVCDRFVQRLCPPCALRVPCVCPAVVRFRCSRAGGSIEINGCSGHAPVMLRSCSGHAPAPHLRPFGTPWDARWMPMEPF